MSVTKSTGQFVWQRLYCADAEKSGSFYKTLFDWRTSLSDQATTTFENSSGITVGDIGTKPTWFEADTWVYFISVSDVSQTAARVTSNGGSLIEHTMIDNHAAIVTKDAQGGVIGFTEF